MSALSFTAGQALTAAQLNLLVPLYVIKGSNQVVTNSAVLVNDNDIVFSLLPNQSYHVALHLLLSATTKVPNGKYNLAVTGTVASVGAAMHVVAPTSPMPAGGAALYTVESGASNAANFGVDTAPVCVKLDGIFSGGASGGTVTLQFAQQTATVATSTTMLAGSFGVARVVS